MDMDSAIMYYFNEVIKPDVEVNKEKVKVIWKEDVDEILNFIKNNIPVV